jgi:HK97 family phage major capsid protein
MTTTLDRNALLAEATALTNRRAFTKADEKRFNDLMVLVARTKNDNSINAYQVAMAEDRAGIPRAPFDDAEARLLFRAYVRQGFLHNGIKAAQTTGTAGGGGALIPQLFFDQLTAILKQYDRLFDPDVVTVVETKTGAPIPFPLLDDVNQEATIIPENLISNKGVDLVFAQLMLPQVPTWRSGWITVPIQLMQDSGVPIEQMLIKALGVRIARGVGAANVATLLAAALVGATATGVPTSNGSNSVGLDDLYSLMRSVDPAYLLGPKCGWAMNFSTLLSLLQITDLSMRPLLHAKYDAAGNFLLLEKPVFICPSMPSIGTNGSPVVGNKPIACGDFSRFVFRRVENTQMLIRATEATGLAENFCVAFQGYLRCNSGLVLDPAQSPADTPIKVLQNASS